MADIILYPNNDNTVTLFSDQVGGTTNIYQSIDDVGAISDADYIKSGGANPSRYIADLSDLSSGSIVSVDMLVRHQVTNASISGKSRIFINGSSYWTVSTTSTSWVTYNHGFDPVNPDTSAPWTASDVNATQMMSYQSGSALYIYLVSAFRLIVRLAEAGMLIQFGWQWIPPFMGLISHGLMCESIDTLKHLAHSVLDTSKCPVPSSLSEFKSLSDAILVRPKFLFLGV